MRASYEGSSQIRWVVSRGQPIRSRRCNLNSNSSNNGKLLIELQLPGAQNPRTRGLTYKKRQPRTVLCHCGARRRLSGNRLRILQVSEARAASRVPRAACVLSAGCRVRGRMSADECGSVWRDMVMKFQRLVMSAVAGSVILGGALGLAQSSEPVDLDAVTRIKAEGFERSQVMDTAWWLTEVHGPRLTNSPQLRAAADWTVKKLDGVGTRATSSRSRGAPTPSSAAAGATSARCVLVTKPSPWPVLAYAQGVDTGHQRARSPRTPCSRRWRREADFDKYRGKLKGKIVLLQEVRARRAALRSAGAPLHARQNLDDDGVAGSRRGRRTRRARRPRRWRRATVRQPSATRS